MNDSYLRSEWTRGANHEKSSHKFHVRSQFPLISSADRDSSYKQVPRDK